MLITSSLLSNKLYAQENKNDSVTITAEMINSYEGCPLNSATQLKCPAYHQTTNYTCGPAAVMTIMRYYGKLGSGELNKDTELRIANEMNATPGMGGGTTISQMSHWLSDHGFNVQTGSNISTDTLIENINKGILVIRHSITTGLSLKAIVAQTRSRQIKMMIK